MQYRIFATNSTYFAIFRRNRLHLDGNLHDCEVFFKASHFWFSRGENNLATHRPYQTANIYHKIKNTKGPSYTFRPFNIRPLRCPETWGTKHPVTWRHIAGQRRTIILYDLQQRKNFQNTNIGTNSSKLSTNSHVHSTHINIYKYQSKWQPSLHSAS